MTKAAFVLLAITMVLLASPLSAQQFVYVNNNSSPNGISGYSLSPTGVLTPIAGGPFLTGGTGGICQDIDSVSIVVAGGYLYATNSGSNTVSGFHIDPANGALTAMTGSPFALRPGGIPTGLAADPGGFFLYVGRGYDFGPGTGLDAFSITPGTGALTLAGAGTYGVGGQAGFDVIFDATRSNVISNQNDNQVSVFSGGGTSTLTAIAGSPFTTPTGNNHKMALRPQGDCLYVAGAATHLLAAMVVSPGGSLSNAAGSPVGTGDTMIGATVTPAGNFAYFGGFAGIRGYSTSSACNLTPVAGSPFASGGGAPNGVTTDAGGSYVLASNRGTSTVSSLAIGGTGALTLTDTKPLQGAASCPVGITTLSCTPPVISGVSASPNTLWPPDHRMVPVTVSYTNSSNCPDTCVLSVASNEPINGLGDTAPDWVVVDATHLMLRAERSATGTGRVYTITITCTNSAGQSSSQTVQVFVPHDQG